MESQRRHGRQSHRHHPEPRKSYRQRRHHTTNVPRLAEICCPDSCGRSERSRQLELANRGGLNRPVGFELSNNKRPIASTWCECRTGTVGGSVAGIGSTGSRIAKGRGCDRWRRAADDMASTARTANRIRCPTRSRRSQEHADSSGRRSHQHLWLRRDRWPTGTDRGGPNLEGMGRQDTVIAIASGPTNPNTSSRNHTTTANGSEKLCIDRPTTCNGRASGCCPKTN